MSRSYSDASYAAKQELVTDAVGALNGTAAAAAEVTRHTFMEPVTATDWNGRVIAGGTDAAVISLIVGKSLAGTGAFAAIGTMALNTHAVDTVIDASLTATTFETGDDLVVQRSIGTSTSVLNIVPVVQFQNRFVANDD